MISAPVSPRGALLAEISGRRFGIFGVFRDALQCVFDIQILCD